MKIVIADGGWGAVKDIAQYLPEGSEILGFQCKTENEVIEACKDADAILAEYSPISRRVFENLKQCKIVSNSAVGTDNIDIDAATEFKVAVANVPNYCSHEVADHTLALLLAANRNIVAYEKAVRDKKWDISSAPSMRRLQGQILGLIGFGKIAQMVARRAMSFGMTVIAYDPYISCDDAKLCNVTIHKMEEVLQQADIVSLHLPLTENTVELFDKEKFKLMAQKPIFINTARGKIVKEADLIDALEKGIISAAALDVLADEPPSFENSLFNMANVIITPHVGFYSDTSVEELRRRCALNVTNFFLMKYGELNILNSQVLKAV